MAYVVIRTIKGRQYRYLQISIRVGKKVKTVSEYLGPVGSILRAPGRAFGAIGGIIEANLTEPGPRFDEDAMSRDVKAKEAAHSRMMERFEKEHGVKVGPSDPVPIEKPVPTVAASIARSSATPSPDVANAHSGVSRETAASAESGSEK
jgi:hypothetical protein